MPKRRLMLCIWLHPRIARNDSIPIIVARITGVSHHTSVPYSRRNQRIIPYCRYRCMGKYLRMKVNIRMTKAILDPLTTRIWVSPEFLNTVSISSEISAVFPMLMPQRSPAISRGKPRKRMFWIFSLTDSNLSITVHFSFLDKKSRITVHFSRVKVLRDVLP